MSLACDFRIAAENAKIGFTFVKVGIHPGHLLHQPTTQLLYILISI